jgi:uncharacterized protein (TIGR00255 family)
MIRSMTGFGAAVTEEESGRYVIEIRAVNNRFFKASVRLPDELAALESDLEAIISKRLHRGSISATARFVPGGAAIAQSINAAAARAAIEQLQEAVPEALRERITIDLGSLLAAPGVIQADSSDSFTDRAREIFTALTAEACDRLVEMRTREGEAVHGELSQFGSRMSEHIEEVKMLAPRVVEAYRDRLRLRIESLIAEVGSTLEEGDLIKEVAIFAERSDVAEELARLEGHVAQFTDLLANKNGEPVGRTLDFLAQEMLREANTIASKSADVEISRRIVEVKGLIDRIKEQAANVE